jgi:peroxiredoxin
MRLAISDQAPPLILQNQAGESINIADIWHKGVTVLTFLRHFG